MQNTNHGPGEETFWMTLIILMVKVMTHITKIKNRNADKALWLAQIVPILGYLENWSSEQTHCESYSVLNDREILALEKMMKSKSNKINLIFSTGFLMPSGFELNSS